MAQKRLTLEELNFGGVNYAPMSPVRKHYKWKGNELIESEEKDAEKYPQVVSREHNIYVKLSADSEEKQITFDGSREIVYGESVHRNEWGIETGIFMSPDRSKVAFYRMDQSMVTDYPQVSIADYEAKYEPDKYPMTGSKSHKVTIGILELSEGKDLTPHYLDLGDVTDRYFTNISWGPDGKTLYLIELNRDQTESHLDAYDGLGVNPGLGLGVSPQNKTIKLILDTYENDHVYTWTGKVTKNIVLRVSQCLRQYQKRDLGNGIFEQGGIIIYPPEFFCPKDYQTGKLSITENTRSIHHFMASWTSNDKSYGKKTVKHIKNIGYRILGTLKRTVT